MAKAPKRPPPEEDEAESLRFIEAAKALEAAGELNLTEGEAAFERASRKILPARRPQPPERE